MHTEAPYEYIRGYYDHVHRVITASPEVAAFWLSSLNHIRGDSVLNVGCGPQLYDYAAYFGKAPKTYVGLDLNRNTFTFMRRSNDPRLLEAKARVREQGTQVEHLCANVMDCGELLSGRFANVLGVGFFATFYGTRFDRLMKLMWRALRPGGTLLKVTWHGPHRSPEETRDKLKYGYDNDKEPPPEALIDGIERAGFTLSHQDMLKCDAQKTGWDAIQVCVFCRNS